MQFAKETKGGWFHPSVRPPYKRVLCRVAIHPDGCTYYAVWDMLHWLTFSTTEQAALSMSTKFDAIFYWKEVRELGYGTTNLGKPPGNDWYRVHLVGTPMLNRGCFLLAYWNGVQWSQAFYRKPTSKAGLVFRDRKFAWISM